MKNANHKDINIIGINRKVIYMLAIFVCLFIILPANQASASYTCGSYCSMTDCDTGLKCATGTMNCDGYGDCSDTDDGGAYCCSLGCNPFGNCPWGKPIPTLVVSCSASPSSINTGSSSTFTATASGGTGSYVYSWSGACSGTASTCSNTFNTQ